ncbi:MAG: ABC transporter substrate-binding protein [Actinomycetota bacterium]|nr:ABC transporter substrate-binding protein [Actinomycetota bacterium]
MRRYSKTAIAISLVAAAATVLAGCTSSKSKGSGATTSASGTSSATSAAAYNAAFSSVVNPSTKTGGTLQLGSTADCDSWDPKIAYYGWCWNMQRLYVRSLIGYQTVNGTSFKLAPDLATDMGTHNATFTQWTYTLKPGLKWSNGTAITPMDVKYGLERNFASAELAGGPSSYFVQGIVAPKNYAGPYKNGDLSSITTTANTITINLSGSNADFDYLMAMGASAPVPYKTEGGPGFVGATYTKHPMSSGPFMIQSYTPGKSINFVRNPNWSQSTDTIHHPLVDGVNLTIDTNPVDLDNKLQAGTLDANAATGAGGLTAQFQSYALTHPAAKAQTDDPTTANVEYLSVMQTVITNADCRKAIFYATNKASILAAEGGPTAGTIAGSMTPPGIGGYSPTLNPFPVGSDNTGDLAKAKAALVSCGKPNGFATKFAYPTPSTKAPKVFAAEKAALARVGITLTAATDDSSTYYSTFIGSPKNILNQGIGMALAGWGADFPTVVGFYQAIANGNSIVDPGNSNYPSLNDPAVNTILDNAPKGQATAADYATLNSTIMNDTVYIPLYFGNTLMYRSTRMTNVTCDNALAFGNYDFVNAGVS